MCYVELRQNGETVRPDIVSVNAICVNKILIYFATHMILAVNVTTGLAPASSPIPNLMIRL